jgi:hypothetical protein
MTQMTTQMESAINTEKNKLDEYLNSAIKSVVANTSSAYKEVFDDIINGLRDTGEIIKSDMEAIESSVKTVISKMETSAESTFSTFKDNVDSAMHKLKDITDNTIQGVSDATSYIRTGAYKEFDLAINKARADFDGFKTRFKNSIASIGDEIIEKTKIGVSDVVSSAQSDIDKLKAMKDAVILDIEAKFSEVKTDLESIKDKATKDMERIIGFIKDELDKLEARIDMMASKANKIGYVIGGVSILAAIAASTFIVAGSVADGNRKKRSDE